MQKQLLKFSGKAATTLIPPVASIVIALTIGAGVIAVMGINPMEAYEAMFRGAFGSVNSIGETLLKSSTLIFVGLSFAIAYRCGLINIGAEGQLYIGALFSIIIGIYVQGLPMIIHLPLAVAAGFLGGGLWGLLSGWLKVRFGANEIITTVMLNYVAINLISFAVTGPLKEEGGNPQTALTAATSQLPIIVDGTRLHLGFLIAVAALIFYYIFLWRTPKGFELRVVGQNSNAASYAGMKINSNVLLAMFLAGGMGGLAGAGEVLGIQHRLLQGFSPGYGFDGIAVALLGANGPVGILLSSILFGVLRAGGNMMQMFSGVPAALIYIIQALVIIFVVAEYLFKFKKKTTQRRSSDTGVSSEVGGDS